MSPGISPQAPAPVGGAAAPVPSAMPPVDETTAAPGRPDEPADWVLALDTPGPDQLLAMRQLHRLLRRAAAHQIWRMRDLVDGCSPQRVDELANGAADAAMTTLLRKLHTFEGRSRFTTWAYKFAILQAAADVRQLAWSRQEVRLRDLDPGDLDLPDPRVDSPEREAEALDLASAVARAMHESLTAYQRQIAVALLVEEVPIDVLAARLGTTRGALYKTVHVARARLRAELTARGYLPETRPTAPTSPDSPPEPR